MYVDLQGQKTFYSTGSQAHQPGRASVLFVHGAGFDHTLWTMPARYFARQGLNVVAVDLPGHGLSDGDALTSIETIAAWLDELLATLNIENTAVVGHSMGSLAALALAADYPARVSRLVLLGTAIPMPVSDMLLDAARDEVASAIDMANTWSHSLHGRQGGNFNPGISIMMSEQRLLERAAPGVYHADFAARDRFDRGEDCAARVNAETTVILGLEDKMTRPASSRAVAAAIQGARVVELEGCGHSMLTEEPNRVLDALIEAVL